MVPILETDLVPCLDCGHLALLVGYWDEEKRRSREQLVKADFVYEFQGRDIHGRLIVREKETAMAASHYWTCPKYTHPTVADLKQKNDDEEETQPYRRKK